MFLHKRTFALSAEGMCVAAGHGLAALGGLVGVRLLTGVMSPTSYGELALAMTMTVLVQQTLLCPVTAALRRFYATSAEKQRIRTFLRAAAELFAWGILLQLGAGILLVLVTLIWFNSHWLWLVLATCLFCFFSGVGDCIQSIHIAARDRVVVAAHVAASQWLRFLIATLCVLWVGTTSTMAMTGFFLAASIILLSQTHFFCTRIRSLAGDSPPAITAQVRQLRRELVRYATAEAASLFLWPELRTKHLLVPKVTTATCGCLFSVVGALCWGLNGVAYAGAATATIYLLWVLWLIRNSMALHCPPISLSVGSATNSIDVPG